MCAAETAQLGAVGKSRRWPVVHVNCMLGLWQSDMSRRARIVAIVQASLKRPLEGVQGPLRRQSNASI